MTQPIDIQSLRTKLEGSRGREYWRSLEAVSETPEFKEFLHREFPQNASEWLDPVGRRGFLKLMGASLTLAGVSACTRQPAEEILPYVRQPEELVPGKPLFYATAMPFAGAGMGLLVESHEGRPTKIEGNPDHPTSRGATDLFAQAAILDLYDPDRSQTLTHLGEIRTFDAFVAALKEVVTAQQGSKGVGLRILSETVTSPTLNAQIDELLGRLPQAKWVQWEPFGRHNAREGSRLAFGEYVDAQYAVEKADVLLSLDADFLCSGGSALKHARAFASRRRIEGHKAEFTRLYAVESSPSNTGSKADHRLPLRASDVESVGPRDRRAGWRECGRGILRSAVRAAVGRRRRQGPAGRTWPQPGDRGRHPAAGCPRPRACHERGAGQRGRHRHLHTGGRSAPDEPARRPAGAGRRDERRHGRRSCSFSAAIRSTRRRPT